MTADELWLEFCEKSGVRAECSAWQFGDDADKLAALVTEGKKTATASAYELYSLDGEPLPEVGEYSVILDSCDRAVCIIRNERVFIKPFCEVDAEQAYREGEGDRSLEYWRRVHKRFFEAELEGSGLKFDERMSVVCEWFEVVYRASDLEALE